MSKIDDRIEETRKLLENHYIQLFSPELYEHVIFLLDYLEQLNSLASKLVDAVESGDIEIYEKP